MPAKYKYDLEERTTLFSEQIIRLSRSIETDLVSQSITGQLVRSATSIGANYAEANAASSKNDFRSKIYICKKEAKETLYWLRLLTTASLSASRERTAELTQEARELLLIFQKITTSLKIKN